MHMYMNDMYVNDMSIVIELSLCQCVPFVTNITITLGCLVVVY